MRKIRRILRPLGGGTLTMCAALLMASFDTIGAARAADNAWVIEDVTLISPDRPSPLLHTDVVIRDGRIAQIGSHLALGPSVRKIDGHAASSSRA